MISQAIFPCLTNLLYMCYNLFRTLQFNYFSGFQRRCSHERHFGSGAHAPERRRSPRHEAEQAPRPQRRNRSRGRHPEPRRARGLEQHGQDEKAEVREEEARPQPAPRKRGKRVPDQSAPAPLAPTTERPRNQWVAGPLHL